jgi:very-short-patch-repair endonuclease
VSVVEALTMLGGVATRRQLVAATSRADVERAIAAGDIHLLARGRYALPAVGEALRHAHRLAGTVSHLSAAQHWGWAVKTTPDRPDVTVARNRNLTLAQRKGVQIHRADLAPDEIVEGVTSRARTLVDCLRDCDFDEALAVADSALRDGQSAKRLVMLAEGSRGPGSRQIRRVAHAASEKAANPFESVLRAIALDVPGLNVRPQVPLYGGAEFLGRPDLVDEALRVVLEADSFEWHGDRAALSNDARRYDAMVVNGWLVLRFAWEDVMFDPDWVRSILEAAVNERTYRPCRTCGAA